MSAIDLEEIRKTAEIIEKIAGDQKAFEEMVDAHDNENADMFQAVLGRLGVLNIVKESASGYALRNVS